jgi:hypothetical protein
MKKYIIRTIILLLCFILTMALSGCTTYTNPYQAANPRHKFESGNRRYERKMRRFNRNKNSLPTIDPLRFHH